MTKICEVCHLPSDEIIERPDSFFEQRLCPSCWNHETDGGLLRNFDAMEGHILGEMFNADGSRVDMEQVAFEQSMVQR